MRTKIQDTNYEIPGTLYHISKINEKGSQPYDLTGITTDSIYVNFDNCMGISNECLVSINPIPLKVLTLLNKGNGSDTVYNTITKINIMK